MKKGALLHLAGCISVQAKFLLILFLALVVVAGACFFSSRLPYAAYDVQLHNANVQTLALFADKIETELNGFSQLSLQILGDNIIQKNLSVMARTSPGEREWIKAKQLIDEHFYSFTQTRQNARALYIQLNHRNIRFSFIRGNRTCELTADTIRQAVHAARAAEGRPAWITVAGNQPTMMLARDIREIRNLTLIPMATIMIDVDVAWIVSSCQAKMAGLSGPLSMAIYDGSLCLYASDDRITQLQMDGDGYGVFQVDGQEMLCTRFTSSQGWQMVSAMPYGEIMSDIRATARLSLLIAIGATALALLCGAVLIASVLRHLDVLLRKMDDFAKGNPPSPEEGGEYQERRDEIGRLHRHFDRMARDYDRVVRDNYENQLFIQEAQTRQLKAQIRPHFLYNTLQSIYCMAQTDGQAQIAAMTDALGKMLHASISDQRDVVPVQDDWIIAREYMRIQLLRYGDRLQIAYEIPPALESTLVPAMTLQPLVENAVQHAAEEMTDTCLIRVYGQISAEGGVDIVVEDNGPGMDEQIIDKLESGEIKPDGLGIGIRNIHRRIQLSFSDAYGLRIRREDGCTRVYIHVPQTKEEASHV